VLLSLMFPSGAALVAVGKARFTLYANLAGVTMTVVFVLLFQPATPWDAVLVWCGTQVFVSPYSMWVNGRALGVGLLWPLHAGVPMLLISAAGVAAAMALDAGSPLEALLRRAGVFILVLAVCGVPWLWSLRAGSFGGRDETAGDDPLESGRLS
jgi:hypothetical protein